MNSKISLTCDIWTSRNGYSFIGVTGPFVDNDWKLKDLLVDFIKLDVEHNGYNMAIALLEYMETLGITGKVMNVKDRDNDGQGF